MYHNDIPKDEYDKYAEQFNPVDFDPAEWAEIAWDAGMRYVVFTTKHHDGFCMFDSKHTDFKITNTPYGKDITAELVEAFRAKGKIPTENVNILSRVGEWMKKYGETIYETYSSEWIPPAGCYYTQKDSESLFLHLINPLMGNLILPQLNEKVERIIVLSDASEIPLITFWGTELLK